MKERWIRWNPFKELTSIYYAESITESSEGLEVVFTDSRVDVKQKAGKIKMKFNCRVTSYRCTDEVGRVRLFGKLGEKYGKDFFCGWHFFIVENSEYLKWLSKESDTYSDYIKVKHYVFMDDDGVLDILSDCEPVFEFI